MLNDSLIPDSTETISTPKIVKYSGVIVLLEPDEISPLTALIPPEDLTATYDTNIDVDTNTNINPDVTTTDNDVVDTDADADKDVETTPVVETPKIVDWGDEKWEYEHESVSNMEVPEGTMKVPTEILKGSLTLKNMIEDCGEDSMHGIRIPVMKCTMELLKLVIKYCKYHHENPNEKSDIVPRSEEEPKKEDTKKKNNNNDDKKKETRKDTMCPWDKEFIETIGKDQPQLFSLMLVANYLENRPLLLLVCLQVANMIKGKTPEQIRKTFNIKNDFTPEEEEKLRTENTWSEDVEGTKQS